ncbi:cytochrome P450 2J6 [Trichonephila clavipes]|nr:cytochrome P450 2J6 [Trichonephila clavipes]
MSYFDGIVTNFLGAFALVLICSYVYNWIRSRNYPPGPLGLPIVGYVPFLGEKPNLTLENLSKKYGDVFSSLAEIVEVEIEVVSPSIVRPFGEVSLSLNRTVTCMVLKANDRRTSCPCHDEFRGPRSDYCQTGGISHNNNNKKKNLTEKSTHEIFT